MSNEAVASDAFALAAGDAAATASEAVAPAALDDDDGDLACEGVGVSCGNADRDAGESRSVMTLEALLGFEEDLEVEP